MRFLVSVIYFSALPLLANLIDVVKYQIPGTNYAIDIPSGWHECSRDSNNIIICQKDYWPNLTITLDTENSAEQLFVKEYKLIQYTSGSEIYGTALIDGTYWFDYQIKSSNGASLRSFNNYKTIEPNKTIKLSYQFYGNNINGFILESCRKLLESFRLEQK